MQRISSVQEVMQKRSVELITSLMLIAPICNDCSPLGPGRAKSEGGSVVRNLESWLIRWVRLKALIKAPLQNNYRIAPNFHGSKIS